MYSGVPPLAMRRFVTPITTDFLRYVGAGAANARRAPTTTVVRALLSN